MNQLKKKSRQRPLMSFKPRQPLITRPHGAAALVIPQAVMNCAAPLRPRICQRSGKRHLTGFPSIFKNHETGTFHFFVQGFYAGMESNNKSRKKKKTSFKERKGQLGFFFFFTLPLRHSCVRQCHTQVRTRLRDKACSCCRGPPAAPSAWPWVWTGKLTENVLQIWYYPNSFRY